MHKKLECLYNWKEVFEKIKELRSKKEIDAFATVSLKEYKSSHFVGIIFEELKNIFKEPEEYLNELPQILPCIYPDNEKFQLFIDEIKTLTSKGDKTYRLLIVVYLKHGEKI